MPNLAFSRSGVNCGTSGRDPYTVFVELKVDCLQQYSDQPALRHGLALRFARVKPYRPDKSTADADTFQTVQALAAAG